MCNTGILLQNLQHITYPPRTQAVHLRPTGVWTRRWKKSATDASTSKLSWCQNCMET